MNPFDPLLDTAFDSYPLAPLPAGFIRRTMARIQPRPRFRLEFLDFALPGFFVCFGTAAIGIAFWLITALNPLWLMQFQHRTQWYAQNLNVLPWGLFAIVSLTAISACTLAGLILLLALDRPLRLPHS